ncbi:hypothetical protein [Pseudoalteromonas ruthenica]|uniref:hypothetical protein n=1 Tax=Pseudoalteromonas ruthenica TaxID=151081 RepID=UPI00034CBD4E|nr:hypothetical protein [Pseudoalteromonas ruthenica]
MWKIKHLPLLRRLLQARNLQRQLAYEQRQRQLTVVQLDRLMERVASLTCADKTLPLVVSLTSYGERLNTLHITLRSLLTQSVPASRYLVWLAHGERLTPELAKLKPFVEFRYCEDIRSYKKLVPTLELDLGLPTVTFDDDVIYPADHLTQLWQQHLAYPQTIIAHRAHRVCWCRSRALAPYKDWQFDIQASNPESAVVPIGIGGVLYPVNSLHPDALNASLFTQLCPYADDIWFKYCALKQGTYAMTVAQPKPYKDYIHVPNSQSISLWSHNRTGNDQQLRALCEYDSAFIDNLQQSPN